MIEVQKLSVSPAQRETNRRERNFCRSRYGLPEAVFAGLTAEYAADCHGCGELSVSVLSNCALRCREVIGAYSFSRRTMPIIIYGGIL